MAAGPRSSTLPFPQLNLTEHSSPRFPAGAGSRLSSEEETRDCWAGPEVEAPPTCMPARAHERVLLGNLRAGFYRLD